MAGRAGRSRLWLSGCGQHFGTVGLATQRLDGGLGRAAGVLGPANPSCGGGAAWHSAGVAIDDFPRQLARTRRFTLGVPRAVTVARDGRPPRSSSGRSAWASLNDPVCLMSPPGRVPSWEVQ
jgi:hypothetical protein